MMNMQSFLNIRFKENKTNAIKGVWAINEAKIEQ